MGMPAVKDLSHYQANDGSIIQKPQLELVTNSGHVFGARSENVIEFAHPDLGDLLRYALLRSAMDFTVYDGGRTLAQQREHVRNGKSDTLNSRHRIDDYRLHYAVDLVPYIDGAINWNPQYYLPVMRAIFHAANVLGVPVNWGGWWTGTSFGRDMPHVALDTRLYPHHGPVSTYRARHRAGHRWEADVKTGKYTHTTFHGGHPAELAAAA